ncbi:MAG: ATP-binding protein [Gemmatimonadales bacterium]
MNRRWKPAAVLIGAGSAIVLLALWVRNPVLPYGAGQPGASGGAAPAASAAEGSHESQAGLRGLEALRTALTEERRRLQLNAERALDAPRNVESAFGYLSHGELSEAEGVILFQGAAPVAWSGQIAVDPSASAVAVSVVITPFYTTMFVSAERGARRAVATALIHAEAPADRLTKTVDSRISGRDELAGYSFATSADTTFGESVFQASGATLLRAEATPLPRDMVGFGSVAVARTRGTLLLGAGLLLLLAFAWRDRKLLGERLLSLLIILIPVTLVPWSSFSNAAQAFDPTYYYSAVGGPLTANAGVLAMAATLLLLAVYAIIRSRRIRPTRAIAAFGAVIMAIAGIALTATAAGGIAYPSWGSTATLWLTWEIPLFVVLVAFWLAALWLARIALGMRSAVQIRGAAAVALLAGATATVIVWRTTTFERLELVAQDIRGLQRVDPNVATLLRRFAMDLSHYDSAGTRDDLLKRYANSDLAAGSLPVSLATWTQTGERLAELRLAQVTYDSAVVARLVAATRDPAHPLVEEILGVNGQEMVLAQRHADNGVTTVVVSPRTQLIPPEPFVSLLGFAPPARTDPPYTLTISDIAPSVAAQSILWSRIGSGLHGDAFIQTSRGVARVHAEVDLRSYAALGERTVLIVILDAAIAGLLWALGAMAEGAFARWLRARGGKWVRSYHGRLTLALLAFFVIPALAFAFWSYQRLRTDDRDVRDLLVRETLEAVVGRTDSSNLEAVPRPYNRPLFLYSGGLLSVTSDALLDDLAPAGRALPPPVYVNLAEHGELNASWQQYVGATRVLFGYRAASGPRQERYVVAAPARSDELTLDRRRRDLAILVLFATVMGAFAALWLSRIAARRLARDLELSRIEVARAERILAWGEMARQVAHEIKNPLTPIRLGVQHLRRARSDPRVNFDRVLDENVTRILSEIDRLDEIARAFSRYGSAPGELPPPESIDVAAILRDVVALEKMGVGDVTWTIAAAENSAFADARVDELRDVLLNLFENARLARARKVSVRLSRMPKTVLMEIVDDGTGINEADMRRVFEPHFSTRTTGSGLGLAISRRLLESWGGTIEIASEEGKGARVLLTLQSAS